MGIKQTFTCDQCGREEALHTWLIECELLPKWHKVTVKTKEEYGTRVRNILCPNCSRDLLSFLEEKRTTQNS